MCASASTQSSCPQEWEVGYESEVLLEQILNNVKADGRIDVWASQEFLNSNAYF